MAANKIILDIQNNTSYNLTFSVLSGDQDTNKSSVNSYTEYLYDILLTNWSTTSTFTIQYKPIGAATFQLAIGMTYSSFSGFIRAINELNLGIWNPVNLSPSSGNVVTYNDDYVFGDLTIT